MLAPATANTISKIANGICDNLLTSIICAFNKPVLIAPAMNTNMWNNPFVQENIKKQEASIEKITNDEADKMINNAILSVKQQKYYAKQMKKRLIFSIAFWIFMFILSLWADNPQPFVEFTSPSQTPN